MGKKGSGGVGGGVNHRFIEEIPSNRFTYIVTIIMASVWFVVGTSLHVAAHIAPYIECQWNLTRFQTAISSSSVYLGESIGSIYFGGLVDMHGRQRILLGVIVFCVYFYALAASATTFAMFVVLRFFNGAFAGAALVISCIYANESVKSKHRTAVFSIIGGAQSAGLFFSTFVAYFVLNRLGWRIYVFIMSSSTLVFLPFIAWLPESLCFLQISGKQNEFKETLSRVSKIIAAPIPKRYINVDDRPVHQQASYRFLFQRYGYVTSVCALLFAVSHMNYYSFIYMTTLTVQSDQCYRHLTREKMVHCQELSNSELLQAVLVSASEIPAYFIVLSCADLLGRKPTIALGLLLNTASYITTLFCLPHMVSIVTVLISRGIACGYSAIMFLYTGELLPTIVRSTGSGICSSFAKFCCVLVPFIFQEFVYWSPLATSAMMVFLCLLCLLVLPLLKETKGELLKAVD